MNRKIIVIEGYLASGMSTFALRLSKSLFVPYLIKDTFSIRRELQGEIPLENLLLRESPDNFTGSF